MASARRMVQAAAKARRIFAVMQNRRFDPRIRALVKFLRSGAIGRITTVNCDFYIGAHFGGFRDRMKHVLILDMAIHTFDAARLITGADPRTVYCHEWNPAASWYDHDASAMAVFEMTGGIVYNYRGSWCSEGLNTTWECDWRIIGEKGSVTWDGGDGFAAQAIVGKEGFKRPLKDLKVAVSTAPSVPQGGHAGVLKDFIRCVRTGRKPETIATDNIKSLAMVFGAIQSADSGRKVAIRA
jgi:predicted dehydrogenase